ncbi:hypothetical protein PR003_g9547 [Phytophthora rubi]|uniref:Integrase catalytic domain-containing protein n=1 Tax=Phytophthora rubi TaxID=129364 RepID=A0A6A4FHU5_9STRA|nr:hypothetical protein PR003_g9547 [Phytophthora rubi]
MERVVLFYGPLRELLMDGAPELNGRVIEELVGLLQARQVTPVPYRPALLGLIEGFHRTWKYMVSMYMSENQTDWDDWLPCEAYAYNGSRHSTTGYSPNELLMRRRLRAPNELLRASGVTQVGQWADYHKKGITKLAHRWVGPTRIEEDVGYDNWRVTRLDDGTSLIAHSSFLTSYHCPDSQLQDIAQWVVAEHAQEEADGAQDEWLPQPVQEDQVGNALQPEAGASRTRAGPPTSEPVEQHVQGRVSVLEPRRVVRAPGGQRTTSGQDEETTGVSEERSHEESGQRLPTAEQTIDPRNSSPRAWAYPSAVTAKRKAVAKGPVRKKRREGNQVRAAEDAEAERRRLQAEKEAREERVARRSARRDGPETAGATKAHADADHGVLDGEAPDGLGRGGQSEVASAIDGEAEIDEGSEQSIKEAEGSSTAVVQALRG